MDTTRRKIVQSIAAAGAAAVVPGVTNAAPSSAIHALPLAATSTVPQPERDGLGGTDPGPRDVEIDIQNPDQLAGQPTDAGDIDNLKWPFGLSHNRLTAGGWARQTTTREFPVSTDMAGVDMRLNPGAIRELHWHVESEWGYVLNGSCQITCLDSRGRNFVDNLNIGDIWFFPSAAPHSIQAFDQGVEFLLVFNNGSFSENDTFLLSDLFNHIPKDVLAKNFGVPVSDFNNLPPATQRYIYPGKVPPMNEKVSDPYGAASPAFSYHMSTNEPIQTSGGYVNIVDSTVFPVTGISVALVTVNPGHMREIHWHSHNEWQYYIEGTARMTAFAAEGTGTFDFQAGDVGYVPNNFVHYIENTGKTLLRFMEVFNTNLYSDFSLAQWMGVTPSWLVQGDLNVPQSFMNALPKTKRVIV